MKKKKFNKNIILFVVCSIFIVSGVFSFSFARSLAGTVYRLVTGQYTIYEAGTNVSNSLNDNLAYHDYLMDLNSVKENLLGTKVIKKDDTTVIKSESGSLIAPVGKIERNDIRKVVEKIQELKRVSELNGAGFLYCAAPSKELYENAPININNSSKDNYEFFLSNLTDSDIPAVDFSKTLKENIPVSDIFYYTDHHWKAYSGFVAANAICEELNTRYGFEYNKQYTDIRNYNTENYPNWFLGSKGKKVGTYFTWSGADDFELITPKFQTDMVEEQPFKKQVRTGSFEDTVLYMDNMKKDYFKVNTYATYSGGDFRLQIIKNNLNPDGRKIVIIRDSFACVVTPFLSLQTSELHICDTRDYEWYVGDKLNMDEYIQSVKPDYVLVLYTGVSNSADSRYDFF